MLHKVVLLFSPHQQRCLFCPLFPFEMERQFSELVTWGIGKKIDEFGDERLRKVTVGSFGSTDGLDGKCLVVHRSMGKRVCVCVRFFTHKRKVILLSGLRWFSLVGFSASLIDLHSLVVQAMEQVDLSNPNKQEMTPRCGDPKGDAAAESARSVRRIPGWSNPEL